MVEGWADVIMDPAFSAREMRWSWISCRSGSAMLSDLVN